jgi:hypothetical protein
MDPSTGGFISADNPATLGTANALTEASALQPGGAGTLGGIIGDLGPTATAQAGSTGLGMFGNAPGAFDIGQPESGLPGLPGILTPADLAGLADQFGAPPAAPTGPTQVADTGGQQTPSTGGSIIANPATPGELESAFPGLHVDQPGGAGAGPGGGIGTVSTPGGGDAGPDVSGGAFSSLTAAGDISGSSGDTPLSNLLLGPGPGDTGVPANPTAAPPTSPPTEPLVNGPTIPTPPPLNPVIDPATEAAIRSYLEQRGFPVNPGTLALANSVWRQNQLGGVGTDVLPPLR